MAKRGWDSNHSNAFEPPVCSNFASYAAHYHLQYEVMIFVYHIKQLCIFA
jgi:hypothetical protein